MFNCLMLITVNRNYTGYPKAGHHMGENNMATWQHGCQNLKPRFFFSPLRELQF